MQEFQFNQEQELNTVNVTDDELREILSRLATEAEANWAGQTTLRDIAELTEVPVNTVARILADMRDDDELTTLTRRVDKGFADHEERLSALEAIRSVPYSSPKQPPIAQPLNEQPKPERPLNHRSPSALIQRELNHLVILPNELKALFDRFALPVPYFLPKEATLLDVSIATGHNVGFLGRILADIRGDKNLALKSDRVIEFQRYLLQEKNNAPKYTPAEIEQLLHQIPPQVEVVKTPSLVNWGEVAPVVFIALIIMLMIGGYWLQK